ncbi:MAG: glycosyltransferase [Anaerolineae bacterium]
MRIAMLSKACIVGAYQRKLEEMAALSGVELLALVPPCWHEGGRTTPLERAHTAGYQMQVLPMAWNGHFHLHYYPTLARVLRAFRPEIVHIDEEPYNLATYLALRTARSLGARTLFFTWQNLFRRYPPPFRQLEAHVLRHADYALVGNQEAEAVLRWKGYRGPAALVPQFGVDPEIYHPAEEATHRVFTIGYAGRIVPAKGVDLLLEAATQLQGAWRLRLAGDGPQRETLKAHARALGIEGYVEWVDHLPSGGMPLFYRSLDVLVLPSRTMPNWKEQFGRVLIEAMACRVAVVGSSSGEIPNVIGDAGLVFTEGDAGALRAALQCLLDEPVLRAELGARGRERVLAKYTQARIAADTVAVYRQMQRPNPSLRSG